MPDFSNNSINLKNSVAENISGGKNNNNLNIKLIIKIVVYFALFLIGILLVKLLLQFLPIG